MEEDLPQVEVVPGSAGWEKCFGFEEDGVGGCFELRGIVTFIIGHASSLPIL